MPIADLAPQKLKNSQHAKEELRSIIIPEDHIMASFDVKSLYTSIPINLAIDSLAEAINADSQLEERTNLSKNDVIELVKICMTSNFF